MATTVQVRLLHMLHMHAPLTSVLIDVDECAEQMSQCDENAVCVNTIGSHECSCAGGYRGNGLFCAGKISCT